MGYQEEGIVVGVAGVVLQWLVVVITITTTTMADDLVVLHHLEVPVPRLLLHDVVDPHDHDHHEAQVEVDGEVVDDLGVGVDREAVLRDPEYVL